MSRDGKFLRKYPLSGGGNMKTGAVYQCVGHTSADGQPCSAQMKWHGDGTGAVKIYSSGVHASQRLPTEFGVPFEYASAVVERKRVTHGSAQRVAQSIEWDAKRGRFPDTDAPPPTAAAVANLLKTARRHAVPSVDTGLTVATIQELLEEMKAPSTPEGYENAADDAPIVLVNRLDDLGFVWTSKQVSTRDGWDTPAVRVDAYGCVRVRVRVCRCVRVRAGACGCVRVRAGAPPLSGRLYATGLGYGRSYM
eukprot:GHVU01226777.1.p1 GENE.GHVU01226777.1~~GHVU01226777.1.p1  ORF type:complete len:251 (-),score=16.97 GHVU01226777.1:1804-2556(-)